MSLSRINSGNPCPLYTVEAAAALECSALALYPHNILMQRAGLAVARWACAIAPYAPRIWIACGPGNNGGDGLQAAANLAHWGYKVQVTWIGDEARMSPNAYLALQYARQAGVSWVTEAPSDLHDQDLCIDALLGLGQDRMPMGRIRHLLGAVARHRGLRLALDIPTGLDASSGQWLGSQIATEKSVAPLTWLATHTLMLLTAKVGLWMGHGRDAAGELWWDDLDCVVPDIHPPSAWLNMPETCPVQAAGLHASHKGCHGDVLVVGGQSPAPGVTGMQGAALLAAQAALHGGAGRVFVSLLGSDNVPVHALAAQPELMERHWRDVDASQCTVVCGCGGGLAVREPLPSLLQTSARLVLDADALNALAQDPRLQSLLAHRSQRGKPSVLTPHPLEAARLLQATVSEVQKSRLQSAQTLADRYGAVVLLKGSGSVLAAPGRTPLINPTGNARLAVAGTGDVLAGLIGARWAGGSGACARSAMAAAAQACYESGYRADVWPSEQALTASRLACSFKR